MTCPADRTAGLTWRAAEQGPGQGQAPEAQHTRGEWTQLRGRDGSNCCPGRGDPTETTPAVLLLLRMEEMGLQG